MNRNLGYKPFEYWKGPKPVLPVSERLSAPKLKNLRLSGTADMPGGTSAAQPLNTMSRRQITLDEKPAPPFGSLSRHLQSQASKGPNSGGSDIKRRDSPQKDAPHLYEEVIQVSSSQPKDASIMSRYDDGERRPWYRRRIAWLLGLLIIIAAIVVAVAVTVTKKNEWNNRYPDYKKLNYSLAETYSGERFFDKFDYREGPDTSNGFVHYVPQDRAAQLNLTYANSQSAFLRVDATVGNTTKPDASTGRFSVRAESKATYNKGLFIFDIKHTPVGCATWPALWLTDRNSDIWPNHGEIDVMESVNQATDGNAMTLHTSDGCTMNGVRRQETGKVNTAGDCQDKKTDHVGCSVNGPKSSMGDEFNQYGGGVMALEWRDEGIRMWQFQRASIPVDIANKSPDPSGWGTAAADFPSTDCDVAKHFKNQSIILNVNVCGDFVYAVYNNSGCPSDCRSFAANNPTAFDNAYWEVGAFDVYQAL